MKDFLNKHTDTHEKNCANNHPTKFVYPLLILPTRANMHITC